MANLAAFNSDSNIKWTVNCVTGDGKIVGLHAPSGLFIQGNFDTIFDTREQAEEALSQVADELEYVTPFLSACTVEQIVNHEIQMKILEIYRDVTGVKSNDKD